MTDKISETAPAADNAGKCETCGHPPHVGGDCVYRDPSGRRCQCRKYDAPSGYAAEYHVAETLHLTEAARKEREDLGQDGTIQAVITLRVDVDSKFAVPGKIKAALTTLQNTGVIKAWYILGGVGEDGRDKLEIIFHANEASERTRGA